MSASLSQPFPPPETTGTKTPLDLKLFYTFVALLVVATVGLVGFWRPNPAAGAKPQTPDQPRRLGGFTLTDQTGRPVTQAEVAGRFVIVNFIHTSCAISCLQVNRQMAEVQRLTAGQADVRLLSLTVDPRTDTPPVLLAFGSQFGANPNRWSLLTGDKTMLYELIETSFLKREPLGSHSPMPGGFLDTDRIAVVDRAGNVRRYFDGMRTATPAAIVQLLAELRAESKAP